MFRPPYIHYTTDIGPRLLEKCTEVASKCSYSYSDREPSRGLCLSQDKSHFFFVDCQLLKLKYGKFSSNPSKTLGVIREIEVLKISQHNFFCCCFGFFSGRWNVCSPTGW